MNAAALRKNTIETLGLLVELQGVVGTAAQWAELSR